LNFLLNTNESSLNEEDNNINIGEYNNINIDEDNNKVVNEDNNFDSQTHDNNSNSTQDNENEIARQIDFNIKNINIYDPSQLKEKGHIRITNIDFPKDKYSRHFSVSY